VRGFLKFGGFWSQIWLGINLKSAAVFERKFKIKFDRALEATRQICFKRQIKAVFAANAQTKAQI